METTKMLKLKRTIFVLVSLFALALFFNNFIGVQAQRGGGAQTPRKRAPKGPAPKVDYKVFDHADPAHKFACETCHDNVVEGQRVTDFPNAHDSRIEPACDNCHNRPIFTIYQSGAMCFICHQKMKKSAGVPKDLTEFPDQRKDQFGIFFPHTTHKNMKAKDFDKTATDIDLFISFNSREPKDQAIAKESNCVECHLKDRKDKKEENYSTPHHAECARCHA